MCHLAILPTDFYTPLCSIGNLLTLKLFKYFINELKAADSSLTVLPFQASKQHYSALIHTKQINTIEENRMHQYFKPYYQKQNYSLSGYFHISSTLTFHEL